MNSERRIKSEMFFAVLYAGLFCIEIAFAVWNFVSGSPWGAVFFGIISLPSALFAAMRLNNCRIMRAVAGRQGDTHA